MKERNGVFRARFRSGAPKNFGTVLKGPMEMAMAQIVIASRLADGRVVFLQKGSTVAAPEWAALIGEAEVAADDVRANELLEIGEADVAARNLVMDAYLIEVEERGGELRPTKYREAIRALGPTTRQDLGKQAEGAKA
jgi:hypothetical protein